MICARSASPCYFDILREHVRSRREISPVRYLMRNDRTSVPSVAVFIQVDFHYTQLFVRNADSLLAFWCFLLEVIV